MALLAVQSARNRRMQHRISVSVWTEHSLQDRLRPVWQQRLHYWSDLQQLRPGLQLRELGGHSKQGQERLKGGEEKRKGELAIIGGDFSLLTGVNKSLFWPNQRWWLLEQKKKLIWLWFHMIFVCCLFVCFCWVELKCVLQRVNKKI